MNRIVMQTLQSALLIIVSIWIGLSVLFYFAQSSYIYFPIKQMVATPAEINLEYEEVVLASSGSVDIFGWYIPHASSRATIIFFHGNGGNISHRLEKIRIFNQLGLNVFIFDYRGYGLSTGKPSESGTYADAVSAYRFITENKGTPADEIIMYGESLGGAIASRTANEYPHGALIIDSGFTSIADMGKHYYPFLPVNIITRIRYPTIQHLEDIDSPLLVIHSTEDEIIPFNHGVELYNAGQGPKTLLQIKGDHNSGFYISEDLYMDGLNTFIDQWY